MTRAKRQAAQAAETQVEQAQAAETQVEQAQAAETQVEQAQAAETQTAGVRYSVAATGSLLYSGRIYKPGEDVTGKFCDERIAELVERGLVKALSKIVAGAI